MSAPIRVVIVDDEPLARDCVRLAVERAEDVTVVAECGDGNEAVAAIRREAPDLVFLDVQMPGLDGFGVLEVIGPELMPAVVLVTAFDRYAIQAFDVHAVDYLLKPFDDSRFDRALDRARDLVAARRQGPVHDRLLGLLESLAPGPDGRRQPGTTRWARRLMVRHGNGLRFVPVDTIDCIEADANQMRIHAGKDVFQLRMTMKELEDRLDPGDFMRIHRSVIVRIDRIREIQPWFAGDYVAVLRDGRQLRIGRSYRDTVLKVVS